MHKAAQPGRELKLTAVAAQKAGGQRAQVERKRQERDDTSEEEVGKA